MQRRCLVDPCWECQQKAAVVVLARQRSWEGKKVGGGRWKRCGESWRTGPDGLQKERRDQKSAFRRANWNGKNVQTYRAVRLSSVISWWGVLAHSRCFGKLCTRGFWMMRKAHLLFWRLRSQSDGLQISRVVAIAPKGGSALSDSNDI